MNSDYRNNVYQHEEEHINLLIECCDSSSIKRKLIDIHYDFCKDYDKKAIRSLNVILKLIDEINFDVSFLKKARMVDQSTLSDTITKNEFIHCRYFVSQLMGVNLDNIKYSILSKPDRQLIEGLCVSCQDDKHHVFIINDSYNVISKDLVVHELGHAAEFTISRLLNNDDLLLKHQAISESIAYFCQYKYLLTHSTKNRRIGSFGSFLYTYLAICTLRYCRNENIPLNELQSEHAINHDAFKNIVDSYSDEGNDFLIEKIDSLKQRFNDINSLAYNEISPRLGMILALYLLDKPIELITEVIENNSINTELTTIIQKIIPNLGVDLSDIQNRITNFFG